MITVEDRSQCPLKTILILLLITQEGGTVDNLKYALKTGILPDGNTFGGSMGEVVRDGT
jgi:hypothetical protein